jgi:hypothetical protein
MDNHSHSDMLSYMHFDAGTDKRDTEAKAEVELIIFSNIHVYVAGH